MATEIVTFWPRGTKPVDLKCVCVFCFVLICFVLFFIETGAYLRQNLGARLATHRKSLHKLNLQLLPTSWDSVWQGLKSSRLRLIKVIRKFAEVFGDYLKISEDHSRFRRIFSF